MPSRDDPLESIRALLRAAAPYCANLVGERGEIVIYVKHGRPSGANATRKVGYEAGEVVA